MRVLIVPELYRPDDVTANATINDAVTWLERWLKRDGNFHAYWLLPPADGADYDPAYVLADDERVTLVEAEPLLSGHELRHVMSESGYSEAQLLALQEGIFGDLGYVDVVIDQLRRGRADLYKWLFALSGRRADRPQPFSVVANVHDLLLPWKYPDSASRNEFQRRTEIADAALSDGIWFKAGIDAHGMREYGSEYLRDQILDEALNGAVLTDSPIDFSRFEESYAERPRWFHVAGSMWEKKHPELLLEIGERLYNGHGIRTLITSMGDVPEEVRAKPWVRAYPRASRETYERMLRMGDLAVCASEYDTLARTWFEQAGSGQVLLLRDEPWVYDCVPTDHRLIADAADLGGLAEWAVEHWEEAVELNRRLVEHVKAVRSPDIAGRRTYADLRRKVAAVERAYAEADVTTPAVDRAIDAIDATEIDLSELNRTTARFTSDGEPTFRPIDDRSLRPQYRGRNRTATAGSAAGDDRCSLYDLVFALRKRGYRDAGDPGTPRFRRNEDAAG